MPRANCGYPQIASISLSSSQLGDDILWRMNIYESIRAKLSGNAAAIDVPVDFGKLLRLAGSDPLFQDIKERFAKANIKNWLQEEEKLFHFGVGAFGPGENIVEIGTFEGGAAIFLAAGLNRRGAGLLSCIDPHLGGPPWLGMAPKQHTLQKFRKHANTCGVAGRIQDWVGDSAAVAAVWPAAPIDVVFIDGDHSYLGALRDFECWAPKVRPGGWIMIDDADDDALPELLELIDELKRLNGVRFLEQVCGVAVFQRGDVAAIELLGELGSMSAHRGLVRPWNMEPIHTKQLPTRFGKSLVASEDGIEEAYQLAYLAKCGSGTYGFTANVLEKDKSILRAVSADREEAQPIVLSDDKVLPCRAIFVELSEIAEFVNFLMPGSVLLTRNPAGNSQESNLQVRRLLLAAGLEGCGWEGEIHWGVWKPFELSTEAIISHTTSCF
jgi:predicted O-methyltransferase YrrM